MRRQVSGRQSGRGARAARECVPLAGGCSWPQLGSHGHAPLELPPLIAEWLAVSESEVVFLLLPDTV